MKQGMHTLILIITYVVNMAVWQGELVGYTNKCENHTMHISQIANLAILAVIFA